MESWSARVFLVIAVLAGCRRESAPASPSAPAAPAAAAAPVAARPVPSKAELRALADAFMRDWIANERHAAYLKMERGVTSEAHMGDIMDRLANVFGKLREAKYHSTATVTSLSFSGLRKQWEFVYDVKTDKQPTGRQATVTVSADPQLAVSEFEITLLSVGSHRGP